MGSHGRGRWFEPSFPAISTHYVANLRDYNATRKSTRPMHSELAHVGAVHAGYAEYRKPLLQGGVEIDELKPDAGKAEKEKLAKLRCDLPPLWPAGGFL